MAQPSFYAPNWDNSLWAVLAQLLSLGPQLPPQLSGRYRYMLHEFIRTWKGGKVPLVGGTCADVCILLTKSIIPLHPRPSSQLATGSVPSVKPAGVLRADQAAR